jgi:hypothetical protein
VRGPVFLNVLETAEGSDNFAIQMSDPVKNCLTASISDLEGVDIDSHLAGAKKLTCTEFRLVIYQTAEAFKEQSQPGPERVFRSLAVLLSFMENFGDRAEPYRPRLIDGNQRSTVPGDLTSDDLDLVEALITKTKSPALLARLGDVLYLHKRRTDLWPATVDAYVTAATDCLAGEPYDSGPLFLRALQLAHRLGRKKPTWEQAEEKVVSTIRDTVSNAEHFVAVRLIGVIFNMGAGKPEEWATIAETEAKRAEAEGKPLWARRYWHQAAGFWHKVRNAENEKTARLNAAESYVQEAEDATHLQPANHIWAARLLTQAVEALRQAGADSARVAEVKKALRDCQHKAVAQSHVPPPVDEKSPLDDLWAMLDEQVAVISEKAEELVSNQPLEQALRRLALGWRIVDVGQIREEVIQSAKDHPLNHLFGSDYADASGRIYHQEKSLMGLSGEEFEVALLSEMYKHAKQNRWATRAAGFIEPARRQLWHDHTPLLHDLECIVTDNPFVPANQQYGLLRGIHAGLSGDWIVAAHLITPRIESCIRHLLELNGVDTANLYSDLTQPVKLLGSLFDLPETKRILTPNYHFELRGHLIEKTGFDLRNRLAHGIATDAECYESPAAIGVWWLFLRICISFKPDIK